MPDDSPLYDEQAVWPDKDVDGARKLVDEYRAAHGGADITLTYVTTAGSPVLNRVAELLQSQIQQVDGLKLDIKSLDGAGFASAMTSGNYDLIISSLGGLTPRTSTRSSAPEPRATTPGTPTRSWTKRSRSPTARAILRS